MSESFRIDGVVVEVTRNLRAGQGWHINPDDRKNRASFAVKVIQPGGGEVRITGATPSGKTSVEGDHTIKVLPLLPRFTGTLVIED